MLADPAAARDVLARQVQAAWERLVAPFWPGIQAVLDADVAYRSRQLTDHGLRRVLEAIDTRISWSDGTILVNDGIDVTLRLRGRGLVLMPSAYIWPAIAAIVDEPWQPTIAYPARGIASLWQEDVLRRTPWSGSSEGPVPRFWPGWTVPSPPPLGALGLHPLSPSGTSKHLIAMRDAGLITGTRYGHEIRYARTQLETDLSPGGHRGDPLSTRW